MIKKSIYQIPIAELARDVFGSSAPEYVRRMNSWLDGEVRMPVNIFHQVCVLCPKIDIERSLRDIHERYELADYKKKNRGGFT